MISRNDIEQALDDPNLARKVINFAQDFFLWDKPALLWSCMPSVTLDVDPTRASVLDALRSGGRLEKRDGWWNGFASRGPRLNFEGIAGVDATSDPGWASEFHSDGTVLCGLWSFPEQNGKTFVCNWHAAAFSDFGVLAAKLNKAVDYSGECMLTCTFFNSDGPSYLQKDNIGFSEVRPPQRRRILQWRVRRAATTDELSSLAEKMGAEYLRAYGYGQI
jgi:hypothetical protein